MMTPPTPLLAGIESFVETVTTGAPPSLRQLVRALDQLPVLVHDTPEGEPTDSEVKAPEKNYRALCDTLRLRFPTLGHYCIVDPLSDCSVPPITGDAVDDLADIVGDLNEVIWRYKNAGAEESFWYLHFLFQVHWGRHLRRLVLYLHESLAADDD